MRIRERGELAVQSATAMTLFSAARDSYGHHGWDPFVVLNVAAAAALAIAVLRGLVQTRRHHDAASTGTNLLGVAGGLAAVVEGLQRLHAANFTPGRPHFALGVFTVFAGLATAAIALLTERLGLSRALRITEDGVRLRLGKFRRFDVSWADIAELQLRDRDARLVRANGRPGVVPLARLVNRAEVRDALANAARAQGIPVTEQLGSTTPDRARRG